MGKTRLKMQTDVYNYNATRWEGDNEGREESTSCAGTVV